MPKLSGNKGEWSEIYVFLYLLALGKLYAADADLQKIESVYYDILAIFRTEAIGKLKFAINKNDNSVSVINEENCTIIETLSMEVFHQWSKKLLDEMLKLKKSDCIEEIEKFLSSIRVNSLKAKNTDKADIVMKIHDINTGFNAVQGFSIKSRLGAPSTLINASGATNFIYELSGNVTQEIIDLFHEKEYFIDKLTLLRDNSCSLNFKDMTNATFKGNLILIDSYLPEICADLLLKYYGGNKSALTDIVNMEEYDNPLNYDLSRGHHFYHYKVKKLLSESALGMLPAKPWDGIADATGGYIVVREDGEVLCYHLFNHNEFEEYLLNNTKFETPSKTKHNFGVIYKDGNHYFLNLNMQIRFIK